MGRTSTGEVERLDPGWRGRVLRDILVIVRAMVPAAAAIAAILGASGRSWATVTVEQAHGQVSVRAKGGKEPRPVAEGAELAVGDEVRAGPASEARLAFGEGVRVTLLPRSSLVVEEDAPKAAAVALSLGRLRAELARLGRAFEVRTPVLVASVRGTRFMVSWSGAVASVAVWEGKVEVRHARRGHVLLGPGEAVDGGPSSLGAVRRDAASTVGERGWAVSRPAGFAPEATRDGASRRWVRSRVEKVQAAGRTWEIRIRETITAVSVPKVWYPGEAWDYACVGSPGRESRESRRWGLPVHRTRCRGEMSLTEGFEVAEDFDGEAARRLFSAVYQWSAEVPARPERALPPEVRRALERLAGEPGEGHAAYLDFVDALAPTKGAPSEDGPPEVDAGPVPLLR